MQQKLKITNNKKPKSFIFGLLLVKHFFNYLKIVSRRVKFIPLSKSALGIK